MRINTPQLGQFVVGRIVETRQAMRVFKLNHVYTCESSHVTAKVQGCCEADVFTQSNLHNMIVLLHKIPTSLVMYQG